MSRWRNASRVSVSYIRPTAWTFSFTFSPCCRSDIRHTHTHTHTHTLTHTHTHTHTQRPLGSVLTGPECVHLAAGRWEEVQFCADMWSDIPIINSLKKGVFHSSSR